MQVAGDVLQHIGNNKCNWKKYKSQNYCLNLTFIICKQVYFKLHLV